MKNFAICLTYHRILGYIFIPVLLRQVPGKEFLTIDERIHSGNLQQYSPILDNDEVRLVKIIEEYSDHNLVKIFSRKIKNVKTFLSSIDDKLFTSQIRPYIEKRMARCIDILQGNDIPVYHKSSMNNIYQSEHIELTDEPIESVFNFIREEGELCYFLSINHNNQEINLYGKEGILLVNDPCRIVIENSLYLFDDIDGKKLLPFFRKEFIRVPQKTERKFLEGFVKNVIRKYRVYSDAFKVEDRETHPQAILSLEASLSGEPVFLLKFRYDSETTYYANRKSDLKVVLKEENSIRTFYRLNRDYVFENNAIFSLLQLGLKNLSDAYFVPLNFENTGKPFAEFELINWLNFNQEDLKSNGFVITQNFSKTKFYLDRIELESNVAENKNDWFDIHIVARFSDFEIPFIKFRNHILQNNRLYELPDGEIAILPEEWFARFRDIFSFSHVENDKISLEKQHYVLLQEGLKGLKDSYSKKLKKLFEDKRESGYEIPENINATLRPYQIRGFNWMFSLYENHFGGCLADDMGLGKTLQTLVLLSKVIMKEKLKDYGPSTSAYEHQLTIFDTVRNKRVMKSKPSLIVVPTSLVHNWINEIMKFAPDLKVAWYGGQNRKPLNYYCENSEIIITSYGIVRNDLEVFRNFYFLYVILDESQLIKNPFSKTYKALLQLKSSCRLVLTGTPIENSLVDLWSQMNFLNPGLLGSLDFFKNEFVSPVERHKNQQQALKLKRLINPFILRRAKNEVATDLPDLSEQLILCDMSEAQSAYYEEEKSKARNVIMQNISIQGVENASIIILQSLMRLRLIANHPVLADDELSFSSGKFDEITRNLLNIVAEGHKVLVFSSFVKHLDLFAGFCHDQQLAYSYLTGETTKRGEVVNRFQNDEEIRIFLISLKAGGFGLNLTAADYVFLLDPWWNPAVEQQALSRAHRIGQNKKVFVYRFITKDSIEEKILRLQEKKSRLADMFAGSSNPFSGISEEEIMDLFT